MRTREGLIDALAEAQRKREQVIVKRYTSRYSCTMYVLIAYWEKRERGLCSLGP